MAKLVEDISGIREILSMPRTVAVLGAHPEPSKPAHYVPEYLAQHGFKIYPVNPRYVGERLWGEDVLEALDQVPKPVDMIDVFRRSEALAAHEEEFLRVKPAPTWIWFQLGIRDNALAERLVATGISVVQDRCMLADHRNLL